MAMRIAGALVIAPILALPLTAAAQPGNTPYFSPPPPTVAPVEPEPKAHFDIGLLAASPKGDWENEVSPDTSPGFHLQLGFAIARDVSLFGGLRYVRVQFDDTQIPESYELTHRELQLGIRFTTRVSPTTKLFLEGNVHSATVSASFEGEGNSESGAGLGARGGLIFMADRKIGIGVALSYASADIEIGDSEDGTNDTFHDAWFSGDAFVSFFF